jgi:hypothetical protein
VSLDLRFPWQAGWSSLKLAAFMDREDAEAFAREHGCRVMRRRMPPTQGPAAPRGQCQAPATSYYSDGACHVSTPFNETLCAIHRRQLGR